MSVITATQQIAILLKTLNIGELKAIEDFAHGIRWRLQEEEKAKLNEIAA